MCHWALSDETNKKRIYQNVIRYNGYNVNVCVGYSYKVFHDVWNIQAAQQEIRNILVDFCSLHTTVTHKSDEV